MSVQAVGMLLTVKVLRAKDVEQVFVQRLDKELGLVVGSMKNNLMPVNDFEKEKACVSYHRDTGYFLWLCVIDNVRTLLKEENYYIYNLN